MTPEKIVRDHIVEYNSGNVEKCLAFIADDIEVILLNENKSLFTGKDTLRQHLQTSFADEDSETVEILELFAMGDYVTTLEEKTTKKTKAKRKLMFIYQVKGSKVLKIWAVRE